MRLTFCAACGSSDDLQPHHLITAAKPEPSHSEGVQKPGRACGNSETWALSSARSGREGISTAYAPLAI